MNRALVERFGASSAASFAMNRALVAIITAVLLAGCGGSGPALVDAGTTGCGGTELCDGIDNDCNGKVDDVDLTRPESCGSCANNCFDLLPHAKAESISCNAGSCAFTECAVNYVDLDPDSPGCERYCVKATSDDRS